MTFRRLSILTIASAVAELATTHDIAPGLPAADGRLRVQGDAVRPDVIIVLQRISSAPTRSAPREPQIFTRRSWTASHAKESCSPGRSPRHLSARRRGPPCSRGAILTGPG